MSAESKIATDLEGILALVIKIKKHQGPLSAKDKALHKKARALIRKAKKEGR